MCLYILCNTYIFLLFVRTTKSATYGSLVFKRGQVIDMARKFVAEEIVPDCIPYPPAAMLNVTFYNGDLMKSGSLYQTDVLQRPPFCSWHHEPDSYYTLSISNIDHDDPAANHSEWQIWLVSNIREDQTTHGVEIFPYDPPVKPFDVQLRGLMRVVFLVHKQPNNAVLNFSNLDDDPYERPRNFKLRTFVETNHLGYPIAGNFFNMIAY